MRLARNLLLVTLGAAASFTLAGGLRAEDAPKTAKCPVSGAEVKVDEKTKTVAVNGTALYFCCANCPKAFAADAEKFVKEAGKCPVNKNGAAKISKESRVVVNNDLFYACCANCPRALTADLSKFVKELKDPVTGKKFEVKPDSPKLVVGKQIYVFANADTKAEFEKDQKKFVVEYK